MKNFITLLLSLLCTNAYATTVNIDWVVDGQTYDSTTCQTGGDFTLPTPAPTKYGYTFRGWHFDEIIGTGSQSGTPTPTNPIEPVFLPLGNTVLRAVGSGDNLIADSYDPTTGKITRRVGVKTLDGTEWWADGLERDYYTGFTGKQNGYIPIICTHFSRFMFYMYENVGFYTADMPNGINSTKDWASWIADQYTNGTPVTIYYPLKTPYEENLQ